MLKIENIIQNSHFYFIGIGGIGMSALAKYLLSVGKTVSGSDKNKTADTEELSSLGAKISYAGNIYRVRQSDVVVYTSAVRPDDREMVAAKKYGVPILKRSELLGAILKNFGCSVAVSGSHGKTTATAMITEILKVAGKAPTAFIGGKYNGKNFVKGADGCCVAEACEYMANFLDLSPQIAVITNIADDHLDYYKTRENLVAAFSEFAKGTKTVVNIDGTEGFKLPENAVSVSLEKDADYKAVKLKRHSGGVYSFVLLKDGKALGKIKLKVVGRHNVYNALCAIAAASLCGADFKSCKTALENFFGVERRMEYLGKINGVKAYADYAHHPDEIAATLSAFAGKNPLVIFQPHTYSRTKILKEKFVSALTGDFITVIYKTYPAREKFDPDGSAYSLYLKLAESGDKCEYCFEEKALKKTVIKNAAKCGAVLFLGAGNIYDLAKKIVKGGII